MFAALRARRASPVVVDVVITVAVFLATVYPSFMLAALAATWWCGPMVALASVPLLWRRKAPIVVALLTGIATTVLAMTRALPDMPYGQLVATYTFAELSAPLWRLAAVVVTIAGIVISVVVPGADVRIFGYTGLAFVTAYALGAGVRGRRTQIALLEERTRRLSEEQVAAAARERARIARDMHDVVAHSVSVMVVQAEGGASVVHTDPDRAEAAFEAVAETGREALVQLRHTLGVLREPAAGAENDAKNTAPVPGLEGIDALVQRTRRTGLDVGLAQHGIPAEPPREVAVTVYRVIQEALTNVVKHAGAKRVTVDLDWSLDALAVTVEDDGRGPDGVNGGHGLVGMRERVDAWGGELATGPAASERGFRVCARLPLARAS
jgi:signal transduction histidine kinase